MQAPYYGLRFFRTYHILLRYLINYNIFDNNIEHRKFSFALFTPLSGTLHILRNIERDIVNEFWPSCKIAVTIVIVKRNFNFPSI